MVVADIQMPQVVQQRKREETSTANIGFSDVGALFGESPAFQEIRAVSQIHNENSVANDFTFLQQSTPRSLWRMTQILSSSMQRLDKSPVAIQPYVIVIDNSSHELDVINLASLFGRDIKTSAFPQVQEVEDEIEEEFLRGVQPLDYQHKVVFSQEVEVRATDLKRWEPTFVFNPNLFDDDE